MSAPEITFYSPSTALINLCQAQVRLLQQCLQLDRCEVYVTEREWAGTTAIPAEETFIPLVIYPQTEKAFVSMAGFSGLPQESGLKTLGSSASFLSPGNKEAIALPPPHSLGSPPMPSAALLLSMEQPLVLPLIYQEEMMGVLVTERRGNPWQSQELQQLELATQTLAIACQLDRGQSWYAIQFEQQQVRQKWERDRFDDLLHQLRNPLTALKTFSKLLFKRLGKEEKVQTIVQGIVREGEHLQALLQSFETQIGELVEPDHPEVWETKAQREELGETPIPLLLPSQNLLLTALEIKPILSLVLFAETAIATESQINLQSDLPDLPPIRGEANALREVF
ncbi:MAG: histidine kinase dimerization/phospho-acceptor domain-containing protein, partial [Microcystaceae cyanobacterium]